MKTLKNILAKFKAHQPVVLAETTVSAAVLVLLMENQTGELSFIITKRPQTIATYAGDYCFPGGMRDASDTSLLVTVKREIEEELQLTTQHYQLLQALDDFQDRYDNLVRPFLAVIGQQEFETYSQQSSDEIESIYYFPVADLPKLARNPRLEKMTLIEPTYSYSKDEVFIWGLTARILVHLGNIIFDLDKPTAKEKRSSMP